MPHYSKEIDDELKYLVKEMFVKVSRMVDIAPKDEPLIFDALQRIAQAFKDFSLTMAEFHREHRKNKEVIKDD